MLFLEALVNLLAKRRDLKHHEIRQDHEISSLHKLLGFSPTTERVKIFPGDRIIYATFAEKFQTNDEYCKAERNLQLERKTERLRVKDKSDRRGETFFLSLNILILAVIRNDSLF